MLKAVSCTIVISTIMAGCMIPTYTGKTKVDNTTASAPAQQIKRVLMVGAGSTPSRVFLEDLSTEVIKRFATYNITCDFNYLGKIPRGSRLNLQNLLNPKYDAYLVLNPKDTSFADTHKSQGVVFSPLPGGYGMSGEIIGNQYKEDYLVELHTKGDSLERVWKAELKVDYDFANTRKVEIAARQIFDELIKYKIISKE